jgi:cytochrome c-type biogenesis protein CcmH/NrfG
MSRGKRRFDPASGKPSRLYIAFVAMMVGLLVICSVALIAGTAFGGDDIDQPDPADNTRPGEEVSRLQTAVAEDPSDTESIAVLANILANSGQLDEAIVWYERAVEADSENGDLRVAFGLALFQSGNDFDAAVQFRGAHELLPDSATPPYYLGQINERGPNPDLDAAREWYAAAVEAAPDSLVGQQAQERLDELDSPALTPAP